jgi:glycosyltransferase involved in cell wall biosynthesis
MARAPRPIVLNGKWLAATATGVQRYAGELARRILERDAAATVIMPADAVRPDWLPEHRVVRSRTRRAFFEQVALPWHARGRLLLSLAASGPLVTREQLIMMPDALTARYPGTYSRRFVAWYALMYRVLVRRARHIVTISQFSRRELAEVLGMPEQRFELVVPGHEHALEESTAPTDPALLAATEHPYVLCIGSLTPSKNLAPVTRALAEAGIPVVVVGASGVKRVYAEEAGLTAPGVHLAGRLSDPELRHLTRGARALVFPSLYEGFGLPVIEAQAVGCPVVASDRASIPEAGGDAALYFDALDPAAAVTLLATLDGERDTLIARGHANVTRFSWEVSADRVLAIASRPW